MTFLLVDSFIQTSSMYYKSIGLQIVNTYLLSTVLLGAGGPNFIGKYKRLKSAKEWWEEPIGWWLVKLDGRLLIDKNDPNHIWN